MQEAVAVVLSREPQALAVQEVEVPASMVLQLLQIKH
jgi:hypothetical protein